MNGYVTIQEMATRRDVSERQVQKMCSYGMIDSAIRFGNSWAIPENTEKPTRTARSKPGSHSKQDNYPALEMEG